MPRRPRRTASRRASPSSRSCRAQLHHVAVLDRPRLALVGVDDHDTRPGLAPHRVPLAPGREAGAAEADEARGFELGQHASGGGAAGSPARPAAQPERRPVRSSGSSRKPFLRAWLARARQDVSPASRTGARSQWPTHATSTRLALGASSCARAHAVADGPGADADDVDRHAQERVERDDLVHLAAADVHVVGERVGELRRDRADLAPDPAEVVEQPRPRGRELSELHGLSVAVPSDERN